MEANYLSKDQIKTTMKFTNFDQRHKFYRGWLDGHAVPIVMDYLTCEDGENIPDSCIVRKSSMFDDCDHSKDIWIQCKGKYL